MKKHPFFPENDEFSRILLKWNRAKNRRKMPWKGERDPYKIWLSEIILQQTRVEQGTSYFNRFIQHFPTINDLAKASDGSVFKLWEGLGYYSRCRNLLQTARTISNDLNGKFPGDYENILSLKGVGPYTAAAISSFAFDLPHAVIDGNVFRVLARITGKKIPVDSGAGKKYFTQLANKWLDKDHPAVYNQAIMDFGATICKPIAPLCKECPFNKVCYAFLNRKIGQLPVKEKKITIRKRWFYYFLLRYKDKTAVVLRDKKDIWQGLYEFPLMETTTEEHPEKIPMLAARANWLKPNEFKLIEVSPVYKQQLSHQQINGRFVLIDLKKKPVMPQWQWLSKAGMAKLPFPRFINRFLDEKQ
jgi:A/G-specific adenine glycosylase